MENIEQLKAENEDLKRQIIVLQEQLNSVMPESLHALIKEENEQLKIVDQAIQKNGINLQKLVAIEEMAELMKEIVKDFRGENNQEQIIEEIADVEIMIQQLSLIYNCTFEVVEMRRKKIERLKKRLENE